jgi:hypothetical protein
MTTALTINRNGAGQMADNQDVSAHDIRQAFHNYRSSLLDTEMRIIAADDRHVVVALRVERAAIASSLHFLAALADLSAGS